VGTAIRTKHGRRGCRSRRRSLCAGALSEKGGTPSARRKKNTRAPLNHLPSLFLFSIPQQQTRLAKFYVPLTDAEQRAAEADVFRATSSARDGGSRTGPQANVMDWGPHKLVVRRYAGLAFAACIDGADPELAALEAIHLFVEVLDHYFGAVCELDLVFNFHKVRNFSVFFFWFFETDGWMDWRDKHTTQRTRCRTSLSLSPTHAQTPHPHSQAYLILDEFVLGGEIQETSKKVILERLGELDRIET
jgi:AP-2 complex subunit sigma-1